MSVPRFVIVLGFALEADMNESRLPPKENKINTSPNIDMALHISVWYPSKVLRLSLPLQNTILWRQEVYR